jgi:hypothetical protein
MKLKNIETLTLDWKEFSEEAFQEFKKALKTFGLYIGDIYVDYYNYKEEEGNGTDTYCLYIAKRKMTPKELKETFETMFPNDDDDQIQLFNLDEYKV